MRRRFFLCTGLGLLLGCGPSKEEAVTIFAAISTRDALQEIADNYQSRTGTSVILSAGASSTLARQIAEADGADLFLSADEAWADYLVNKGLVAERRAFLANHLVVVVPAQGGLPIHELADLAGPDVERLALAGPQVPAGRYARQALAKSGVWDRVKDRVINAANVRAALTYVVRGEADAGFVYQTDAASSAAVQIAVRVKDNLHCPIRYPLVFMRRTLVKAAARSFYDYLHSEEAAASFRRHGFEIIP